MSPLAIVFGAWLLLAGAALAQTASDAARRSPRRRTPRSRWPARRAASASRRDHRRVRRRHRAAPRQPAAAARRRRRWRQRQGVRRGRRAGRRAGGRWRFRAKGRPRRPTPRSATRARSVPPLHARPAPPSAGRRAAVAAAALRARAARLAGVVLEMRPPRAMLQDNSGMGYIVTPGTPIGRRHGVVKAIEPGRLVVEEHVLDYYGRQQPHQVVIEMPKTTRQADERGEAMKRVASGMGVGNAWSRRARADGTAVGVRAAAGHVGRGAPHRSTPPSSRPKTSPTSASPRSSRRQRRAARSASSRSSTTTASRASSPSSTGRPPTSRMCCSAIRTAC